VVTSLYRLEVSIKRLKRVALFSKDGTWPGRIRVPREYDRVSSARSHVVGNQTAHFSETPGKT
jgi:hypothetical protein